MKALEKDRRRRYETANGFAADVLRNRNVGAVQTHQPSTAYRVKTFVRRNKGRVAAAGLVLLALVAGVIGTGIGLVRANRSAENERLAKIDAEEKQEKAEKAYARTADVLDTMVSEVTGDSLATQKVITPEQKQSLAQELTCYQEFAEVKADERKTRELTTRAAGRVGLIEYRLGQTEKAAAAFRKTCDGAAALAAEFPGDPNSRLYLS